MLSVDGSGGATPGREGTTALSEICIAPVKPLEHLIGDCKIDLFMYLFIFSATPFAPGEKKIPKAIPG